MSDNGVVVAMRGVTKLFGRIRAVKEIDLDIHRGRILGLLGANGAGKSTLLRHIIGLYLPDHGRCTTLDCPTAKLGPAELARIGYVHQEGELIDWMTAAQLIRYVSVYYETWNKALEGKLIEQFEISPKARVGSLSPGQRQRLAILIAICFEPELLILDEPAAALDPLARAQFLDLLLQLIQEPGRTIVISSHILSDVEKVIDHAVMMKAGRIVADASFDELREKYSRIHLTALTGKLPETLEFPNVVESNRNESEASLIVQDLPAERIEAAAERLNCQAQTQPLPLEDIYRLIVG